MAEILSAGTLEVFDRRNKYGSVTHLKTKSKITKSKFSFCLTPKKEYLGEKQAIINLHFYRMLHRLEAENFSLQLWEISVKPNKKLPAIVFGNCYSETFITQKGSKVNKTCND